MLRKYTGVRVPVNANGYLEKERDWSLSIGESIAEELNIVMTADHWVVVNIVREAYAEGRKVPDWALILKRSLRRMENIGGLFPDQPEEMIARIAGMPKALGG